MQQTFQRQFHDREGVADDIKTDVYKEAHVYFNGRDISLVSEKHEPLDSGLTLYTAVYAPAQPAGGQ